MKKILFLFAALTSVWQLHAESYTWSAPTTISTPGIDSTVPLVVIDSGGNATAAWIEGTTLQSSSLPFAGSWGAPTSLSGAGATSPSIDVDSGGNVTAVWLEGGVVTTANLPFGGSWSVSTSISLSGASDPALDVDATGNAVAVWVRGGQIESAQQPFGGGWSAVTILSGASSDNPAVALGGSGTIVAAWHSVIAGQDEVLSAVGSIGGAWGSPLTVNAAMDSSNYPAVAVDGNGNAVALFFSYAQSGNSFFRVFPLVASLTSGGTQWSIPLVLDDESFRNPADLMSLVAFDSDGNAFALWTSSYNGSLFNIVAAKRPLGLEWTNHSALVLLNLYAFQGAFSLSPSGDLSSLCMAFDGLGDLSIFSSDADASSPYAPYWSAPMVASVGSENGYPSIATTVISGVANAVGVWIFNDGSNNVVVASVGTRNVVIPPSGTGIVQSSTNMGVLTEYFNTVSWSASSDPNLLGYYIYRNGIYWDQVGAGTLSVIDHNAVQSGAVTYGVAAFNTTLKQSDTITASFP
ncbi:MAG: hypothetical protein V4492_08510 [Chlamydiota bacterium]